MKTHQKTIVYIFLIIQAGMFFPFIYNLIKECLNKNQDERAVVLAQYNKIMIKHGIIRQSLVLTSKIKYLISGKIVSNSVIDGKNDWLFYCNKEDGNLIADYKGENYPDEAGIEQIKIGLSNNYNYLKNKGIGFILFVAPNKGRIYTRYLPDKIKPVEKMTADYVVEKLQKANLPFPVIYPKDELIALSDKYQVYYPRDTHWNLLGSYIGYRKLMKIGFDLDLPTLESLNIHEKPSADKGDLVNMVKLEKYYPNLTEYYLKEFDDIKSENSEKYINLNPIINKSVLVICDSFGEGLKKYFIKTFSRVLFVTRKNYTFETFEKFSPNVVIFESVGRLIHSKEHIDFYLGFDSKSK